jgi:tRNA pseudouridine38-40 synthase
MPTFKITVAYDGTDFVGWQRQASGSSIQGLLEEALLPLDEREVTVTGAGRTDAGVHALAQVAAFTLARELSPDAVGRALNARLPNAVRILAVEAVPASFHPRFDARSKTYRYRIWNGAVSSPFEHRYAWHLPGALNVAAMRQAAPLLEGQHDFAAFMGTGSDAATTVRRVFASRIADWGLRNDCGLRIGCGLRTELRRDNEPRRDGELHGDGQLQRDGEVSRDSEPQLDSEAGSAIRNPQSALLVYEISGDGFLRHMVRAIVGSLVEIGRGRQPVEWMARVLESRDRSLAGPTAPAAGLFLARVDYAPTRRSALATEP